MANSRERRILRRALQEAGQWSPPVASKRPAIQIPLSRWSLFRDTLSRVPKWIYAGVAGAAAIVGLLVLYPWLSIERDFSSDPSNPFTENFYVVNEGYVTAKNIRIACVRNYDIGTEMFRDINEEDRDKVIIENLAYKRKASIPCTPREMIRTDPILITNATMNVVVIYQIGWIPFKRAQSFPFHLTTDSSGKYHWLYAG